MASPDKTPQRVGICWKDAETFWWDATGKPNCPVCPDVDDGLHGFFVPEAEVVRLREALQRIERREDDDPAQIASDALEEEWGVNA